MTQVVLPNTITGGTPMVASQVQADLQALRDVVNGGLEGGTTVDSNMKAKGLTMRELNALALQFAGASAIMQAGVIGAGDMAVTPGAGLQLNYAAGTALVPDDGSVHTSGLLIPATVVGSSVTIGANASGNPRLDQVVLTLSGLGTASVTVVPGTPTVGATLANRSGAAALPAKSIRLADVLVTNGFAGPFVAGTSLRDRRPWARGGYAHIRRNTNASSVDDYTTTATVPVQVDATNLSVRMETSGGPVRLSILATVQGNANPQPVAFYAWVDGAADQASSVSKTVRSTAIGADMGVSFDFLISPAAGSHTFAIAWATAAGTTATMLARAAYGVNFIVQELPQGEALYNGKI